MYKSSLQGWPKFKVRGHAAIWAWIGQISTKAAAIVCGNVAFCSGRGQLSTWPLQSSDPTWFSALYLKSGYCQVKVHPLIEKGQLLPQEQAGLWQFRVMLFGLCNATAILEHLMENVLAGLPITACLIYLDDVQPYIVDQIRNLWVVLFCLRTIVLSLLI